MRIAIIGAGAIGGVLAWYLAPHCDLVIVDQWADHVAALNRGGLHCERDGVVEARPVHAVSDPALALPAQLALVLVKAHQTAWAAEACAAALAPDGLAYTLQNGLGNQAILAGQLGATRVGQGVTTLGGTLLGPGRVRHAGMGATTLSLTPNPVQANALADLLNQAGLPTSVTGDLDTLIWGKLIVNAGINAITALLRVRNGVLAENSAARSLLSAVVTEAVRVAEAQGITLPYTDPVAHVLQVARATAANQSSMLQDRLRGAPTEIATINGAIVAIGTQLGIATPYNATLVALITALEATEGAGASVAAA
ncbi:2-dehydropantoate 2-reductase [Candidatus Chloroploca sp. M-50]|uniref:2-dehydropantoate 2-reductase n=1 Tax=Candidatus Chloroploca mongolica TaxID=2528176 RepID=A0ABS4D489_9CHLR|nr:2-dehydropantoate 2-reductase [Candidatus Chloroploca mongolica]MBP1464259.1 2-dehydropantoate 2-reductase [Candidatus Chloroploca mongolica]